MRLNLVTLLAVAVAALPAWAQDDDLAPMPAGPKKPAAQKAPAPKPGKPPPSTTAGADDDLAPAPKPAAAKPAKPVKPAPAATAGADDDLAPAPKPAAAKPAKPVKPAPSATAGADDDLAPLPVARAGGTLKVKVPAALTNAVLAIDGKDQGVLPLPEPLKLAPGEHSVLVKRVGYAVFVKKVTIAPGKLVELDAKLQPVAAVLSVTSDVGDAQVFIDGRLLSTVPISELELPAKTVELSVRREGFKDSTRTLVLVAGRDYPISVKFKEGVASTVVATSDRPVDTSLTPGDHPDDGLGVTAAPSTVAPLTQRWYFWAGVAAVVTAAAVGTTVAVNNAQPPRRLTEQDICGGKCDACIGLQCVAGAAASGAGIVHW